VSDVIDRLLEVEREARAVIEKAEQEAGQLVENAREEARRIVEEGHEEGRRRAEEILQESVRRLDEQRKERLERERARLPSAEGVDEAVLNKTADFVVGVIAGGDEGTD